MLVLDGCVRKILIIMVNIDKLTSLIRMWILQHKCLNSDLNTFFVEITGMAGWYAIQAQKRGLVGIRYLHRPFIVFHYI